MITSTLNRFFRSFCCGFFPCVSFPHAHDHLLILIRKHDLAMLANTLNSRRDIFDFDGKTNLHTQTHADKIKTTQKNKKKWKKMCNTE